MSLKYFDCLVYYRDRKPFHLEKLGPSQKPLSFLIHIFQKHFHQKKFFLDKIGYLITWVMVHKRGILQ